MQYDNTGKVDLWKNDRPGDNQPILKGTAYAHRDLKAGEAFDIALWKNDSTNSKAPTLKGKMSDKRQAQGGFAKSAPEDDLDF